MFPRYLQLVASRPPERPRTPAPDGGDLALLGLILGVNLVPLVGEAVARGHWGAGTLGLATAGALVSGRELALGVLPRLRSGGVRALLRRDR